MAKETTEITIKYLYRQGKNWFLYLLSKWLWFVLAGCLGGALALWYIWDEKPTYTAGLSFILSNNSSGGGLTGLASQFGLDLGTSSDAFSSDNITSLMNSKIMVEKALFAKPPQSKATLLNLFVKDQSMNKGWEQSPRTKNSYPFPDDPDKMDYPQDSLFRGIYNDIVNNYLVVSRPDRGLSVYLVETKSKNETFSMYLTKYLVETTSRFYIETKTSVAKSNLTMLQHEADSIHSILRGSIASTARVYDNTYNLNPAFQTQRIPAQEGQLSITAVSSAYGEVLRNLEIAKINLQKETPLFQIIDEPQLPLVAEKSSKLVALVAGGLLGGILVALFFIIKRILPNL